MQSFEDLATFISNNTSLQGHVPNHVCIIINDLCSPWSEQKEYITTITWHHLIKWTYKNKDGEFFTVKNNIIFSSSIEEALEKASAFDYAFITKIGFIYAKSISYFFDVFKKSGLLCKKDNNNNTLFLNLEKLRREEGSLLTNILSFKKPVGYEYLTAAELELRTLIKPQTANYLQADSEWNILYLNNNERYIENKYYLPSKKFDVIYSHAGGAISEFLWKEYGHQHTKLVIYDNHIATLEWKRKCYDIATSYDDVTALARIISKKHSSLIDECEYRDSLINYNKNLFSNNKWVECFDEIKNVDFISTDVVTDNLLDVDINRTNLLYFSNIFAYLPNIHRNSILSIHEKFTQYTVLANTAVFGDNVFKDKVFIDNTNTTKHKHILQSGYNV